MTRPAPPPSVRRIARTLEEAGFETWAVGGAVRDALAGRPSQDWDLTTRATPGQMRKLFRRTVPIGVDHGTVGILDQEGVMYEVTTFRRDVETTGRHAVVAFAETVEEDLARRDFTINAVAWHPLREELFDPFGGASDLEAGLLRTVGAPEDRFSEDYLRILRGLRFAGVFGLTVEDRTWAAMTEAVPRMGMLSAERVREEMEKVLAHRAPPSASLVLYAQSGALAFLYPELDALIGIPSPGRPDDEWSHALRTVDLLPSDALPLRWAGLLQAIGFPEGEGGPASIRGIVRSATLLERLRSSNARVKEVSGLVGRVRFPPSHDADEAELRRWVAATGRPLLGGVCRIWAAMARADQSVKAETASPAQVAEHSDRLKGIARSGVPLAVDELDFDGRELIRMGFRPGPHFGEVLAHLLERVLDDPGLNDDARLAPMAVRWLEERGITPRGDGPRGGSREESKDGAE